MKNILAEKDDIIIFLLVQRYFFTHLHAMFPNINMISNLSMTDLFWGIIQPFSFYFILFFLHVKAVGVYCIILDTVFWIDFLWHFQEKGILTLIPLDSSDRHISVFQTVIYYRIIHSLGIYKVSICLVVNTAIREQHCLLYHRYFKISHGNVETKYKFVRLCSQMGRGSE